MSITPADALYQTTDSHFKEKWRQHDKQIAMDMGAFYTTCTTPSRIARMKFKYADSSKAFYDALLKRFKERFGEPDEYRGDPFHIVIAWKWAFMDESNNDISLILQHNTRDEEEKQGNSIKLTMWNLLQQEMSCFEKRHPDTADSENTHFNFNKKSQINWEQFVPQ